MASTFRERFFTNALKEFDVGEGNFGVPESFETKHGTNPRFYTTMILFDYII